MAERRPAVTPQVMVDRCTGCGACLAACTARAISMEHLANGRKHAVIHGGLCELHGDCHLACPHDVITVWKWQRPET